MWDIVVGLLLITIGYFLVLAGISGLRFLWHRATRPYYVKPGMVFDKKTGLVRGTGGYWKNT